MKAQAPLTVDVRDILRSGGEPFGEIMAALGRLAPGQGLRLVATFKPVPLFAVMAKRGYDHAEREIGGGDWEVVFTPVAAASSEAEPAAQAAATDRPPWGAPAASLDNRGLLPPEPMVRTLETLGAMELGAVLEVLTDREPLFLYNELKARGHEFRAEARGDAGYRIVIRRGGSAGAAA